MNEQPETTPGDDFVSKYYTMDPDYDDLIPTGMELSIGMKVLIEDQSRRQSVPDDGPHGLPPHQLYLLSKWNRWGTIVSYPATTPKDEIYFLIEYADGTKKQIRTDKYDAWYVKKDTMPVEPEIVSGYITYTDDNGGETTWTFEEFQKVFANMTRQGPKEGLQDALRTLPGPQALWDQSGDLGLTNSWIVPDGFTERLVMGGPHDDGSTPPVPKARRLDG